MAARSGVSFAAPMPAKKFGPEDLALFADPKSLKTAHLHTTSSPKRKQAPTTPTARNKARPTPSGLPSTSVSPSSLAVDTLKLRSDRLGTLVRKLASAYLNAESWETFVEDFRGRSYLAAELDDIDHPAAELLRLWRDEGVPSVSDSPPWSDEMKDYCIQRGCHKSATEHSEFLREELSEFIENKFWMVLPYSLVRHLELMFSPAAVKDERDRKPRLLCDHSWPWAGWPSVNDSTVPHAPPEAMQFGRALPRILRDVRHANPKFGPTRASKQDIKDGFYRLFLRVLDCLRLALVLPRYEGEEQLIAIPMACTMGWVQSPPTFCTMSETICDLANKFIRERQPRDSEHRLESAASSQDDLDASLLPREREPEDEAANALLRSVTGVVALPPDDGRPAGPSNSMYNRPLGSTDVFVDDFIQLGQGGRKRMVALRGYLLEAIDQVLARPTVDEKHRNEAVSLKKLLKGDGSWGTRKVILGWILDTIRQTLELPAHRKATLAQIFHDLAATKRVSHKKWMHYLGLLRFVSVAIPGSAGLFSALQLALTASKGNRIRITKALRSHINAFASLAADLAVRPTYLAEIVPQEPTLLGATDAAKAGMGGVYFDASGQGYVWRFPFPEDVQRDLVSADNPTGRVTNSDLEHAGLLAQASLMCHEHDLRYATIANGSDNTPAVSRVSKGAVTSDGPAAHLCNFACMHQRQHRYCHQAFYLPGPVNTMADDASRLQTLTDPAFLAHFEQHYPQPTPWLLLQLPPEHSSRLMQALRSKSPALPILESIGKPKARSSGSGPNSVSAMGMIQPSVLSTAKKTSSLSCSSSCGGTDTAASVASLSELASYLPSSQPWGRGYPTWDTKIHASRLEQPSSIPYSLISSARSKKKTTQLPDHTQSASSSYADSTLCSTPKTQFGAHSTNTSSPSSSSPSTGSSGQQNTYTPRTLNPEAKPFYYGTSISPSTIESGMPPIPTALCMTRPASHTSPMLRCSSLTKRTQ